MFLHMRGLCPDSKLDQYYIPRNRQRSGQVDLIGLMSSVIEYQASERVWRLTVHGLPQNTTAVSESLFSTFVLGTHDWVISEDNPVCSLKGQPYTKTLKLTGCREGEFTCRDGQCIRRGEQCIRH